MSVPQLRLGEENADGLCEQDGCCQVAPLAPIDGVTLLLTKIAIPRYGVWP
jgi:hypothetical protein